MKKFIITMLVALMLLTMTACGGNKVYMNLPVFGLATEEYTECKDAGEVYVMRFSGDDAKYYLVQKTHVLFMT